jgi:hypothetical protein
MGYRIRNSQGYKDWAAQAAQPTQAQKDAYNASVANAQSLAAQGQQAAKQQLSGYNQMGAMKDASLAAINTQTQISPVKKSPSQGIGQPITPQPQGAASPKGSAQVDPVGAMAAKAAVANQIGSNQNQFTLPSSQGIKLGGS